MHVSLYCLAAAAAAAGGHVVLVICMVDSWASSCESVESLCCLFFSLISNSYNCIYHYQYSQSCAVLAVLGL